MARQGIVGALAGLVLLAPGAAGPLQDAIASRDVLKLEELSRTAAAPEEARLASGAALSLRHNDGAALALLQSLTGARPEIRGSACWAMADVLLRQGRYGEVRDALRCAAAAMPLNPESRQVLSYAETLAGQAPMRLERPAAGTLAVRRDAAGLLRLRVAVGGSEVAAVLDTDASFSAVSEWRARSLGIHVFERPLTVITATRSDQPMRLGIAKDLSFGNAVFHDVVFAVLPDRAMQFRPDYRMDVVIGLPVFVALGRIELVQQDGLTLAYGAWPGAPAGEANMALSGLDPFALVKDVRTGAVLRLAIDTAADTTTLNATAVRAYPALVEGVSNSWAHWLGAGGGRTDSGAHMLGERTLAVAGRSLRLTRLKVLSDDEPDRHGAIGQDLLRQAPRWTIDFDAMRFTVGE